MQPSYIKLPEELYALLMREAERMEMDAEALVEGLIKNFLKKQKTFIKRREVTYPDESSVGAGERRTHERVTVEMSAMIYSRIDGGRKAMYKSGEVRDIAPGGVMVECEKLPPFDPCFTPGRLFELIFQLDSNEPPLHVQCEICRVEKDEDKIRLGVAFKELNPELAPEKLKKLPAKHLLEEPPAA